MGVHVQHADRDREVRQRKQDDQRHREVPVRGRRHEQTEGQQRGPAHDVSKGPDIRRVLKLEHPAAELRLFGRRDRCRRAGPVVFLVMSVLPG